MKLIFFGFILSWHAMATTFEMKEIPLSQIEETREVKSGLCVVNHGATFTRFDRCRTNEVMIGIQDLNPITLRCAQLVINCRRSTPLEDYLK